MNAKDLAVVTVTDYAPDRAGLRKECFASVKAALPDGARHIVMLNGQYETAQSAAYLCAPYVAQVDDDDRLVAGALEACMEAMEKTGAAVAFTNERRIDAAGNELYVKNHPIVRSEIAMSPMAIHHMAVVRKDAVEQEALDLVQKLGVGGDWIVKAMAALKHGVVHVPIVGYEWRQHGRQISKTIQHRAKWQEQVIKAREVLWKYVKHDELVQVWGAA